PGNSWASKKTIRKDCFSVSDRRRPTRRHLPYPPCSGDWGDNGHFDQSELTADERRRGREATDDPGKINKCNLLSRQDRIMNEYQIGRGIRLWVITCLDKGGSTTVLLPEGY